MNKDIEPRENLQTKFFGLQAQLLEHLSGHYGENPPIVPKITIAIKDSGKNSFHALVLEANGKWSGRGNQTEIDLGDPISLGAILREYAIIKDKDYVDTILRNGFEKKDTYYIASHRRRLLQGLTGDMETVLKDLQDSPS